MLLAASTITSPRSRLTVTPRLFSLTEAAFAHLNHRAVRRSQNVQIFRRAHAARLSEKWLSSAASLTALRVGNHISRALRILDRRRKLARLIIETLGDRTIRQIMNGKVAATLNVQRWFCSIRLQMRVVTAWVDERQPSRSWRLVGTLRNFASDDTECIRSYDCEEQRREPSKFPSRRNGVKRH